MALTDNDVIYPQWPAPANVRALTTLRTGGHSIGPYSSNNLALHVGDDEKTVLRNRTALMQYCSLKTSPLWLNQVHGTNILLEAKVNCEADASTTTLKQQTCVVMTADCLPVLLCNKAGTRVAAIHAGWRGLAEGIVEKTLEKFSDEKSSVMAWLGPAIGPTAFEVGAEVRQRFLDTDTGSEDAFKSGSNGKFFADLYRLAEYRLRSKGVSEVYGGDFCTYSDRSRFFSYRRENICGRMATLIWMDNP